MASSNIVYKIMRSDGLFSTGGYDPYFTNKGKAWGTLGALKNHLKLFYQHRRGTPWYGELCRFDWKLEIYKDCKVMQYKIVEPKFEGTLSVEEFIEEWQSKTK